MITREMMIEMIEALGNDAFMWERSDGLIDVTIHDFEGFDDDWSEIMRDYDNPEAVSDFEEMLEEQCESQEGDFYVTYHFDGFDVQLGYSSFDI